LAKALQVSPEDLQINQPPTPPPVLSRGFAKDLYNSEEEIIREALQETSGNRRKAAKLLGISEATLYRRLNEYQI
jgi:transcriptional regulator with PAS, ATPase and Fis domain